MVTQDTSMAILAINIVIIKYKYLINMIFFLTKPQLIKSEVLIVKDYNWMDRKEEMSFNKQ